MEPNVNSVVEQKQAQVSDSKVSLGYTYCNVHVCVGYSKDV
jgi:hypothetical protein